MAGLGAVLEGDAESVLRLPRPPRAVAGPPAKLVAALGVVGLLETHRVFLKCATEVAGVKLKEHHGRQKIRMSHLALPVNVALLPLRDVYVMPWYLLLKGIILVHVTIRFVTPHSNDSWWINLLLTEV